MVSFQIIKKPDVLLAIAATVHMLLKKGGMSVSGTLKSRE